MVEVKYSYLTTLWKGVKALIYYGLGFALGMIANWDPAITSLTVGTVLTMGINWLKMNLKD